MVFVGPPPPSPKPNSIIDSRLRSWSLYLFTLSSQLGDVGHSVVRIGRREVRENFTAVDAFPDKCVVRGLIESVP